MVSEKKIQAGLELIAAINASSLSIQELRKILHDLITKDWDLVSEILKAAMEEGLVERLEEERVYRITPEASGLEFDKPKITKQNEQSTCALCGKRLKVGYYVVLTAHTYGPFGSTCIRKVRLWMEV